MLSTLKTVVEISLRNLTVSLVSPAGSCCRLCELHAPPSEIAVFLGKLLQAAMQTVQTELLSMAI